MSKLRAVRSMDEFRRTYLPKHREELVREGEAPRDTVKRRAREMLRRVRKLLKEASDED